MLFYLKLGIDMLTILKNDNVNKKLINPTYKF